MVSTTGIVKVRKTQDIVIDFPAFLSNLYVKEGQKVKLGDTLFTLNTEDFQLDIDRKKMELNNTRNELQKSLTNTIQLQNNKAILEEKLKQSEQDLSSRKKLYQLGTISKNELDTFEQVHRLS